MTTGTSNAVDENGDYRYFEDIYFSDWNAQEGEWEPAELFSENVNSPTHDAVLSMSPDGKELYVYKNDNIKKQSSKFYKNRFILSYQNKTIIIETKSII